MKILIVLLVITLISGAFGTWNNSWNIEDWTDSNTTTHTRRNNNININNTIKINNNAEDNNEININNNNRRFYLNGQDIILMPSTIPNDIGSIDNSGNASNSDIPTNCTVVTKDSNYLSFIPEKTKYITAHISSGQSTGLHTLSCVSPADGLSVSVTVCDWSAPPQVQFSLDDKYIIIVRNDPAGLYNGSATIHVKQLCSQQV